MEHAGELNTVGIICLFVIVGAINGVCWSWFYGDSEPSSGN